ncbi:hypothetical protein, partial [Neorhizobium sp. DT-125]|uniref:hypothetical protein n=1 Tax=Neorhizobium sp. DT-125 TaxID=3396163 RepID=UPI003F1C370B
QSTIPVTHPRNPQKSGSQQLFVRAGRPALFPNRYAPPSLWKDGDIERSRLSDRAWPTIRDGREKSE